VWGGDWWLLNQERWWLETSFAVYLVSSATKLRTREMVISLSVMLDPKVSLKRLVFQKVGKTPFALY
jgi:hypothetical protein